MSEINKITDTQNLSNNKCTPCEGGAMPINKTEAEILLKKLNGWLLDNEAKFIQREFRFANFKEALEFTNKVGNLAETEGHHPDIELSWGKVVIILTTHAIGGLSGNDFILASKINEI